MILLEKTKVVGLEEAVRGMRNPMNSWDRSDSYVCKTSRPFPEMCETCWLRGTKCAVGFVVGASDRELMMKLAKGGSVHAKYRRMIAVYVDVTAPLYWWKEFDTYKVGTVANSCSTMHKIHAKEFTIEDFSREHLNDSFLECLFDTIRTLNSNRKAFVSWKDDYMMTQKDYWWQMIQLLPSSYNQKRTLMLNYEVLAGLYPQRRDHKLDEWREFCKWVEGLPCSEVITCNA